MNFTHTILVDDDPVLRFGIKKMITEHLYQKHFNSFASGYDAIDYLNNFNSTDENCKILVLLDFHMPILPGREFLKLFEKQLMHKTDMINIHILSSILVDKEKQKLLEHDLVEGFIKKPVTFEELREFFTPK